MKKKLDNKLANGGKPDGSNPSEVNKKDVSSNKTQRSKKTKPQTNAASTETTSDVAPKPSGKVRLLQKSGPEIQQNAGAHRLFQMATAPLQANFSKSKQKCAANFTVISKILDTLYRNSVTIYQNIRFFSRFFHVFSRFVNSISIISSMNKPSTTRRPRKKQAEHTNQPNKETDTEKHQKKTYKFVKAKTQL